MVVEARRDIDLICLGETMGLIASGVGERFGESPIVPRIGGAESNVAIAAARLGARVTWVSRVGADSVGDLIVRTVRGEGVSVHVQRDPVRRTGLMLKERSVAGRTRVIYYRDGSAASQVDAGWLSDRLLDSARALHLTGITPALAPDAPAAVLSIVERAAAAGVLISFDVNYRSRLWSEESAAVFVRSILPRVDVLFGGMSELAMLVGDVSAANEESVVRALRGFGVAEVVMKRGARGARVEAEGVSLAVEASPVAVVDTVGAGDVFVGTYLAALLEGRSVADRLARAVRAGALQCTVPGDWEGAPSADDLESHHGADPVER